MFDTGFAAAEATVIPALRKPIETAARILKAAQNIADTCRYVI
jgi:hypothetical protein